MPMDAPISSRPLSPLRPEAEKAPTSGIVDVFNYGRNRQGLIPLWVGEGDMPTPPFICEAATRSLAAGETFYTYQRGIPELRQAIARYIARVYDRTADPERFFVTSGGMPALMMAVRMVAGTGDEILVPTPAWPNFEGTIVVAGAQPVGRRPRPTCAGCLISPGGTGSGSSRTKSTGGLSSTRRSPSATTARRRSGM
jgi:aspartate/methionine/tyrosine aminotransferase